MKENHSKVEFLKHPLLKVQKYLMPSDLKISTEQCQMIFKMRSRVTEVKINQQIKFENHQCETCGETNETQEHILNCPEILNI